MKSYLLLIFPLLLVSCVTLPKSFSSLEDDSFVHSKSETVFQKQIGEFKRIEPKEYAPDGSNISVGYNLRSTDFITATIYIYAQDYRGKKPSLGDELSSVIEAIEYYNPSSELVEEKEIKHTVDGETINGKFSEVTFMNQLNKKIKTLTYLYDYKNWFVKYRITIDLDKSSNADKIVEAFLKELNWPKKPY